VPALPHRSFGAPSHKVQHVQKNHHCKCLIQCGLKVIFGRRTKAGDGCGGTCCDTCMWEHQCRHCKTWNTDAHEECRDVRSTWDAPPNGTTWQELGPDRNNPPNPQPDSKRMALWVRWAVEWATIQQQQQSSMTTVICVQRCV